jgi:hypothetical protein
MNEARLIAHNKEKLEIYTVVKSISYVIMGGDQTQFLVWLKFTGTRAQKDSGRVYFPRKSLQKATIQRS